MGSGITASLPIDEDYIPLKTCLVERFEERSGSERFDHDRSQEQDLLLVDLFKRSTRDGVLLLGSPGAGKATGLRQWCWRLASGEALPRVACRCLSRRLSIVSLTTGTTSASTNQVSRWRAGPPRLQRRLPPCPRSVLSWSQAQRERTGREGLRGPTGGEQTRAGGAGDVF